MSEHAAVVFLPLEAPFTAMYMENLQLPRGATAVM